MYSHEHFKGVVIEKINAGALEMFLIDYWAVTTVTRVTRLQSKNTLSRYTLPSYVKKYSFPTEATCSCLMHT